MKVHRLVESHDQAIVRLAALAQERGLRVYVHEVNGRSEYFVTSASQPGYLHRTTLLSCDCPGFVRNGRCTHHSALLAELDELPELPEPPTPAAMTERRAERVQAMDPDHARSIERQARAWLTDLIARQERGEAVAERDLIEACDAVNLYAGIAGSNRTTVALAA